MLTTKITLLGQNLERSASLLLGNDSSSRPVNEGTRVLINQQQFSAQQFAQKSGN